MKRLALLMALLLASLARGQSIEGPTKPIKPKELAWLTITGVEPKSTATFFPNPQVQAGPPHIVPQHALFWAAAAGTYQVNAMVVSVNWQAQQITLIPLSHTVVVEEGGPVPPPPPPPGKKQIAFFLESSKLPSLPRSQIDLLSSLSLRQEVVAAGCVFLGSFDVDMSGPNSIPDRLKPWWAAIKGDPLPRLAMAPASGGAITDVDLPADAAAFWKTIGAK